MLTLGPEHVGRRILVGQILPSLGGSPVTTAKEFRVLELSPSGCWVKMLGERAEGPTWCEVTKVRLLEVLEGAGRPCGPPGLRRRRGTGRRA